MEIKKLLESDNASDFTTGICYLNAQDHFVCTNTGFSHKLSVFKYIQPNDLGHIKIVACFRGHWGRLIYHTSNDYSMRIFNNRKEMKVLKSIIKLLNMNGSISVK